MKGKLLYKIDIKCDKIKRVTIQFGGIILNKYILEYYHQAGFHAGSKARDDIYEFLRESGFKRVIFYENKNKLKRLVHFMTLPISLLKISNKSIVLIQYPLIGSTKYFLPILKTLKLKKCKIVLMLHDIESLRCNLSKFDIDIDIELFNKMDVLISHNQNMTNWLLENGVLSQIVNLGCFDYAVVNQSFEFKPLSLNDKMEIIFAGNLDINKSGFLYKIQVDQFKSMVINAYGINYNEKEVDNEVIKYKGAFKPEKLPEEMSGHFALIWDGDSLETCNGPFGHYLKFNHPHKLSLYIASSVPVITWKNAAIANFIEKENIGFTIDSLTELPGKLKLMDNNTYHIYMENINKLRNYLINGYYINQVIDTICFEE